MDVFSD